MAKQERPKQIHKSASMQKTGEVATYSFPKAQVIRRGFDSNQGFKKTANSLGGNVTMGPSFFYSPELTPESWMLPKCLVGDTSILLADGSAKTLKEMYDAETKKIEVLTIDPKTGKEEVGIAQYVACTGKDKQLIKVILSDNFSIRCTYEHKLLLDNLEYKQAIKLSIGDKIKSYSGNYEVIGLVKDGIEDVYDPVEVTPNHNFVIANGNLKQGIYSCNSRQEVIKWSFHPHTKVFTNLGTRNIEDLKVGDNVLSANGLYQPILDTYNREYEGEMVTIFPSYLNSLTVTDYHPVLGIKHKKCSWKNAASGGVKCKPDCKFQKGGCQRLYKDYKMIWISAGLLEEGDFVVLPRFKEIEQEQVFDLASYITLEAVKEKAYTVKDDCIITNNYGKKITRHIKYSNDLFRLLGWYVAEGSGKNGISFSLNESEMEIAKDIQRMLKEVFNLDSKIEKTSKAGHGIEVMFNSRLVAKFFSDHCGYLAENKQIPDFVLKAQTNYLKEFIIAWATGDGCISKKKDTLSVSTVSEKLANQCILAFSKIGIVCSVNRSRDNKIKKIGSGEEFKANFDNFTIKITGNRLNSLFPEIYNNPNTHNPLYFEDENNFYIPIKKIEKKHYVGKIYDLTTPDNSVVSPIISHNCRIFFNLDPWIKSILTLHSRYPFSKFHLVCQDPKMKSKFEESIFNDEFDLYADLILPASLSKQKFGEAILMGVWDADHKCWKSFTLLDPDLIEIRQDILTGQKTFEMTATTEIRKLVEDGVKDGREFPSVLLDSIRENRKIPLDGEGVPLNNPDGKPYEPPKISIIADITDPGSIRGTPKIQALFKSLILKDKLRLAQIAIADRHHLPVELWTVGQWTGDPTTSILPDEETLNDIRTMIQNAMQIPPFSIVYGPLLKYEALSVSGKLLNIYDDLTYIENEFLVGLGVSKAILTGDGPCLDEKTRIMTKTGLKYYGELTYDDEIATLNPETNKLEYHKPTYIHVQEYKGNMIHFKTQKIDHMVSPKHKCWVKNRLSNKWDFVEASKVHKRSNFKLAVGWEGKELSEISILDKKIPVDVFLEFLGYWLSEGFVQCNNFIDNKNNCHQVGLSQTLDSKYFDVMSACMDKMPFNFHKYPHSMKYDYADGIRKECKLMDWICCSKEFALYIMKNFGKGCFNKKIPLWIKELDSKYLKILLDALMRGDGTIHAPSGRSSKEYYTYMTTSRQLAEDVFEISLKCGNTPSISISKTCADNDFYHVRWSEYQQQQFGLQSGRFTKNKGKEISILPYEGIIWCVDVPNHIFLSERNGRFVFTGNSFSNVKTMALQRLIMEYQCERDQFTNWIKRYVLLPISIANDFKDPVTGKYIVPDIQWEKSLDIDGLQQERDFYLKLWEKGLITTKTLFSKLPEEMDYEKEHRGLELEVGSIYDNGKRLPKKFNPASLSSSETGSTGMGGSITPPEGIEEAGGGAGAEIAPPEGVEESSPKTETLIEAPEGVEEAPISEEGV